MNDQTDTQLLAAYAAQRSEPAFAELVRRHVDLVHSAAQRMVGGDAHLAQDVTQGVFLALAKNAAQLADRAELAGWLHRTAQNLAAQTVRTDVRRRAREQEAAAMNATSVNDQEPSWQAIAPHLDTALGELPDADREAVLLRYFARQSAREMAQTIGTSEDAAQKRTARALDRLREIFSKRGVTIGVSGLAVMISANAVSAAPAGLALAISSAAATSFVGTTVATTAKIIAMTTIQKTLIATTVAALAGVGIYEARQATQLREQIELIRAQQPPLMAQLDRAENETKRLSDLVAVQNEAIANQSRMRYDTGGKVKSILLAELPSKLQAAMLLPDREREHELYEIAGLISANDYANAIAVANGTLTIYGDQQIFMRAVLQAWARSNPRTASEYVLTLPANGVRDEILKLTIGSWASQDPLAAIQFANALPTGSGRDWALCFAASAWSQADAPAAWKWATSLPEGEARVLAIQATLQMLSERSPDDAANYAAQLSGAELVRAVRALIQNTSISNPSWTADWVKDFPPSEARNQAVEMLVKRWAEKDPISASDWLLKQPQDQGFQDAIKHICSKALKVSPALAWDWAMRIGDEKARKLSTQTVAHHWLGLDVQAARAKIQASGLPAEQISKLLEQSQ